MIGQEILREFVEGMGENVGAATALKYVMEGNFVERYRKKMSASSLLLYSFSVNSKFSFSF